MPNRRKFIDKSKAVTFQLVHRSQHDPLIADDTVGERVLVPLNSEQRKEEQRKYGINYDDDYDYLQHLRDPCAPPEEYSVYVDQTKHEGDEMDDDDDDYEDEDEVEVDPKIDPIARFNLPSTVFESKTTNEIGMLNLGVPDSDPKTHWDPDIVAALDDDEFDYELEENLLDDDFVIKANDIEPLANDECDELEDEIINEPLPTTVQPHFVPKTNKPIPLALRRFLDQDDDDENDDNDLDRPLRPNMFHNDDDKQTSKTKYTNYSMTSSIIRRNQGLQDIDQHFDKIFDQYDDEEIGALDSHDVNPNGLSIEDELVKQTVVEFEKQQMQTDKKIEQIAMEKTKSLAKRLMTESEPITTIVVEDDDKVDEKWDCETILTTYSNAYNHPKLIGQPTKSKIRLSNKTGLPLNDKEQVIVEDSSDEDDHQERIIIERKKGETSEERRARKNAIKEMRRERRITKKATKVAFKQEEQKQLHEQSLRAAQAHLQSLRVS